ncbi:hypothetical protein AKJ16_DCAP07704, partial [Drosera capensis]
VFAEKDFNRTIRLGRVRPIQQQPASHTAHRVSHCIPWETTNGRCRGSSGTRRRCDTDVAIPARHKVDGDSKFYLSSSTLILAILEPSTCSSVSFRAFCISFITALPPAWMQKWSNAFLKSGTYGFHFGLINFLPMNARANLNGGTTHTEEATGKKHRSLRAAVHA